MRENVVGAQRCIGIKAEGGGQKLVNVAALEIAAGLGLEMLEFPGFSGEGKIRFIAAYRGKPP